MKFDIDSFREIADSLTRNKSRSFLTGFGVFWGLFMLLFLLGGGQGLKIMFQRNFAGFATNTTILYPQNTTLPYKGLKEGRWWSLTYSDIDRLKQHFPELEAITPMVSGWGATAVYDINTMSCNIRGVNQDYAKIEEPKIKYGRYLNSIDVERSRKVCVIGKRVYNTLFPGGGDPCGKFIKVGPAYYQIVGVDFNTGNISINGSTDRSVVIPVSVVRIIYNRGNNVDLICMTGRNGLKLSTISDQIRGVIGREHIVDPKDKESIMLLNTEQLFQVMDNLFNGVNFMVWLVGIGTLLAGIIGVSNIMMVTVRERTTEIGIRRAIGATPKDILSQIIFESIALTLVAGLSGIVFSVFLLNGLEMITASTGSPTEFQIDFVTASLTALLLTLLGILAGLAPALRAMRIKPVDAMRDE
jgi:putative ABC transport system permease protein